MSRLLMRTVAGSLFVLSVAAFPGCGDDDTEPSDTPQSTEALFELDVDLADPAHFYDLPFPSDLRLNAAGAPDYAGFPNPQAVPLVEGLLTIAQDRPGFAISSAAHFRFAGPVQTLDPAQPIEVSIDAPAFLVDIDPDSPDRGTLLPIVGKTLESDDYTAENVVAFAPWPGIQMRPNRTYAYVVTTALTDASGKPIAASSAFRQLASGETPSGALGADASAAYAPLFETLDTLGVADEAIASATILTTGDVVANTFDLSERVLEQYEVTITDLVLASGDDADQPGFCHLEGQVVYPQFQTGEPSFDTDGLFEIGSDGLPVWQRDETATIRILLPKTTMPDAGYPLVTFFHGSGGESDSFMHPKLTEEKHLNVGPAAPITAQGIAMAASALPLNPERIPGASELEYINYNNLAALRDTFRQGVLEQRMFIKALSELEIEPLALASCVGPELAGAATSYRFDVERVMAMGQSMGGMYTNMIGAVEPMIKAAVPTGAGGYWTYFIFETSIIENTEGLLRLVLGTQAPLSNMHPVLAMGQQALEPADPYVYMPRLGKDPLPGHPARPIYEPVAPGDSYFPTTVYDAMALAYGHPQAGEIIWPELQDALGLISLDGIRDYPVRQNLMSTNGSSYTGIIVQYEGVAPFDPHSIYSTRDDVKYQYSCFLRSWVDTGEATVFAPAALGSPCQ